MSRLGLSSGGGSYIRFQPSVNSWIMGDEEIDLKQFAVDFGSIKTGWGRMATGEAPEWRWDEKLGARTKIPSDEKDAKGNLMWKRGFAVTLFIKEIGVVEWSSTGTGPVMGLEAIFDPMEAAIGSDEGAIPILEYIGSTAQKIGKGQTRVPNFKVVKTLPAGKIDFSGTDEGGSAPKEEPKAPPKEEPKREPPKQTRQADDEF